MKRKPKATGPLFGEHYPNKAFSPTFDEATPLEEAQADADPQDDSEDLIDLYQFWDPTKAPGKVRTLAEMSEDEIKALEAKYGMPVRRPAKRKAGGQ